jgi:hypothetical protein
MKGQNSYNLLRKDRSLGNQNNLYCSGNQKAVLLKDIRLQGCTDSQVYAISEDNL